MKGVFIKEGELKIQEGHPHPVQGKVHSQEETQIIFLTQIKFQA